MLYQKGKVQKKIEYYSTTTGKSIVIITIPFYFYNLILNPKITSVEI